MKQKIEANEKLIHVKFEYQEALESKKDILELEQDVIKIIRSMQNYRTIRNQELKLRAKIHRKIKGTQIKMKRLKASVPKINIPKEIIPKKTRTKTNIKKAQPHYDDSLEAELKEIQNKLAKLQQ